MDTTAKINSNTAASSSITLYYIDASKGNVTLTLYDVTSTNGNRMTVVRTDHISSNLVTVTGFSSSQTINNMINFDVGTSVTRNHYTFGSQDAKWNIV